MDKLLWCNSRRNDRVVNSVWKMVVDVKRRSLDEYRKHRSGKVQDWKEECRTVVVAEARLL